MLNINISLESKMIVGQSLVGFHSSWDTFSLEIFCYGFEITAVGINSARCHGVWIALYSKIFCGFWAFKKSFFVVQIVVKVTVRISQRTWYPDENLQTKGWSNDILDLISCGALGRRFQIFYRYL